MTEILQNISLKPYNTFGLEAKAKYFVVFKSVEELKEILSKEKFKNIMVLTFTRKTRVKAIKGQTLQTPI